MPIAAAVAGLGNAVAVVGGAVASLAAVPAAVRGFVDALNPQAGLRLDQAMRGLYATIGQALEPILLGAATAVDAFAGAIVGAMDALRPSISAVTGLFQSVLRPVLGMVKTVFDGLASAAAALMPIFRLIGTYLEGWYSVLNVIVKVLTVLGVALLKGLIEPLGGLTDVGKFLTDVFVGLASTILEVTGVFLELIGRGDLFKEILTALTATMPGKGRAGAPTGYGISDLSDLYRRRLVASAQAMGAGSVEVQQLGVMEEIRKTCARMLEKMGGPAARALPDEAENRWPRRNERGDGGGEGGEW